MSGLSKRTNSTQWQYALRHLHRLSIGQICRAQQKHPVFVLFSRIRICRHWYSLSRLFERDRTRQQYNHWCQMPRLSKWLYFCSTQWSLCHLPNWTLRRGGQHQIGQPRRLCDVWCWPKQCSLAQPMHALQCWFAPRIKCFPSMGL